MLGRSELKATRHSTGKYWSSLDCKCPPLRAKAGDHKRRGFKGASESKQIEVARCSPPESPGHLKVTLGVLEDAAARLSAHVRKALFGFRMIVMKTLNAFPNS